MLIESQEAELDKDVTQLSEPALALDGDTIDSLRRIVEWLARTEDDAVCTKSYAKVRGRREHACLLFFLLSNGMRT